MTPKRQQRIEWDLAGLTLNRPVQSETLLVPERIELHPGGVDAESARGFRAFNPDGWSPETSSRDGQPPFQVEVIRIVGPCIIWTWPRTKSVTPGAGLLDQFLRLRDAPDDDILRFVRKWGPLGMCIHGLPCGHSSVPGEEGGIGSCEPMYLVEGDRHTAFRNYMIATLYSRRRFEEHHEWLKLQADSIPRGVRFVEPLYHWRKLATTANQILDLGALVNERLRGLPRKAIETGKMIGKLKSLANEWLNTANLRPALTWQRQRKEWQIELEPLDSTSDLFAHIGLALSLAVADKDGFAICSSCHKSFIPSRRPAQTRRTYCDTCRATGAPWRDAARDRRKRLHAQQR